MAACIVLLSGGIDSTTALYWARSRYDDVQALTFDYGQRHRIEVRMARRIARKLNIRHAVLKINLNQIGGSALTDMTIPVPRFRSTADLEKVGVRSPLYTRHPGYIKESRKSVKWRSDPELTPTYVPFRNGILIALAAAWAEARGIADIVCGFNVIDSPNYPDTREEFRKAMETAVNLGTRAAFGGKRMKIVAPFIALKKSEIIRRGLKLGADYSYTVSCYSGQEKPCGSCSSCLLRQKAWQEAEAEDPLLARLRAKTKRKEGRR
jgi:7-cyano-7-deazaguanine synthase